LRISRTLVVVLGVIGAALLVLPAGALALPNGGASGTSDTAVCSTASAGSYACDALIVTKDGHPYQASSSDATAAATAISGYYPTNLQSAYGLTAASAADGKGQTVALVDAYDDPTAAADLATYRKQFGLPTVATCTVSGGKISSPGGPCFTKVSQTGSTSKLPSSNASWAEEESLDVDMVSATCPNCNIVLVEAKTPSDANLGTGVNEAAALGAKEISNSYGGSESSSDLTYDSKYYDHPGIAITASSGDDAYGVEYPAASQYVTAVGGTSLTQSSTTSRGWTETAWDDAGAGCSADDPQPTWQSAVTNITGVCSKRAVADVSFDADPNTGVAVYDSTSYEGYKGWLVFGGTSVASPAIAGVYALAGNATSVNYGSYPYAHTSSLFDVTSGSDGSCKSETLCTATTGWDGPTGLGTPDGIGAF
jgi:subtilase family serine protease